MELITNMEAIFYSGGTAINYTPAADVVAGTVVVQGELVGVAKIDMTANEPGALHITGEYDFAKTDGVGEAILVGKKVYWDDTNNVATENAAAGANKYIGITSLGATDNDTAVKVVMSQ